MLSNDRLAAFENEVLELMRWSTYIFSLSTKRRGAVGGSVGILNIIALSLFPHRWAVGEVKFECLDFVASLLMIPFEICHNRYCGCENAEDVCQCVAITEIHGVHSRSERGGYHPRQSEYQADCRR